MRSVALLLILAKEVIARFLGRLLQFPWSSDGPRLPAPRPLFLEGQQKESPLRLPYWGTTPGGPIYVEPGAPASIQARRVSIWAGARAGFLKGMRCFGSSVVTMR